MALLDLKEMEEYVRDITPDRVAEALFYLDGEPFSLKNHGVWRLPYQTQGPEKLFKSGRQVAKSVTVCQEAITHCAMVNFFKILYLSASSKQTIRFSADKLRPAIKYSPIIRQTMTGKDTSDNVLRKDFTNGSIIELSYIGDDAERIRGFTADEVIVDEVQDVRFGELPIAYECMQASDYKWKRFAGTPKSMGNTIEMLWARSSKHEWVVICEKCNKCNVPDDDDIWKMVGREGPVCLECGAVLNVRRGGWTQMNESWDGILTGFHIPQIVIPENVEGTDRYGRKKWYQILDKIHKSGYSKRRFSNEVLGISWDEGGREVSLTELKACCVLGPMETLEGLIGNYIQRVIGVDWGVAAENSFTVATVMGITPAGEIHVLKCCKYQGVDTFEQCKDIMRMLRKYRCSHIAGDAGVGHSNHMHIRNAMGPNIVMEMMYVTQNYLMKYNADAMHGLGRHTLDRTATLNLMFFDLKNRKILFPEYRNPDPDADPRLNMEMYVQDILAIHEDQLLTGRKVYTHDEDEPDDFAHALNFGSLALRRLSGQPIVDIPLEDYL